MKLEVLTLATEWAKIAGAIVVFSIGLWQYAKAQRWRRREFIAAQVKEFESDKKIQLAMTMLDWNNRELYFPSEASDKPIALKVDTALLCSAFLPHQWVKCYSKEEEMIRDCFDRFLDMLVMFWNFIDAGLISRDELRPYMQYWIRLISGQMTDWHTSQLFYLLLNHIQVYGFTGAALLIKSFGYNPQPPKAALDEAIKATLEKRSESIWHSDADHVSKSP
jgi:hypothetical protein